MKTLDELRRTDCRWPVGDDKPQRFCAEPAVTGKPYCDGHCAQAYRPAPKLADEDYRRLADALSQQRWKDRSRTHHAPHETTLDVVAALSQRGFQ